MSCGWGATGYDQRDMHCAFVVKCVVVDLLAGELISAGCFQSDTTIFVVYATDLLTLVGETQEYARTYNIIWIFSDKSSQGPSHRDQSTGYRL